MTDAELIELVESRMPQDLSAGEIAELRERLKSSPPLQSVLLEHLQFEQYLGEGLGHVQVSVDRILATAASGATPANRTAALFGWAFCFTAGCFVLAALILTTSNSAQVVEQEQPASAVGGTVKATAQHSPQKLANTAVAAAPPEESSPAGATGTPVVSPQVATPLPEPQPAARQQQVASAETPKAAENPAQAVIPQKQAAEGAAHAKEPLPPSPAKAVDLWPELTRPGAAPLVPDVAFDDFGSQRSGLNQNELKRWLAPVAGHSHRFYEGNRGNVSVSGFEGLLRLKAPWPADAVLRLSPFEQDGLVVYFWNGEQGVSLHYYHNQRQSWAAYKIRRQGKEPRPVAYALVATDDHRYERSYLGPLEIRHQEGTLVVNRGDIRLLTAPLASAPSEVYFDRRAWLRAFTMFRGEPFPEVPALEATEQNARNVLSSSTPAPLDWSAIATPGATLVRRDDKGVELRTDKAAGFVSTSVPIGGPSLYEIIFQVQDATPGTGIYLGDATGKPVHLLGFFREQRTGWTTIGFQRPTGENGIVSNFDINTQPAPFSGDQPWLRLVAGSGTLKCWISGDGVHWSRAMEPLRGVRGAFSRVGLFSIKTDAAKQITLRQLQVRELNAIADLAPAGLRNSVPAPVLVPDLTASAWLTRVIENQPQGADAATWRRACAVRTLADVPPAAFGNLLLAGLLEEHLKQPAPLETSLRLLDQAAQVFDAWDYSESYKFTRFYEQLGASLVRQGQTQPYTLIGRALMTTSMWTSAQFQAMPESLVRSELLELVYADKWADVRALCRRIKFWNQPSHPEMRWPDHRARIKPLVDWADATASRLLSEKRSADGEPSILPANWRHPLIVELSKEGFNTLSEMEAALSEESYGDACQIISSAKPDLALGLLPDARDTRLLVSLPQAVAASMRDYPALRKTMNDKFGKLGRLRVQQAIAEVNPLVLKAATVQFYGTEAAAEAHVWMGDRALAAGDFARAIAEYQLGLPSAGESQRGTLAARMRLTAAMLGRDLGTPATESVVFHETRLTPAEFEQLVAEMKQKALSSGASPFAMAASVAPASATPPKPARYDVVPRGRWQGDMGLNAGNPTSGNVDWVARQLACQAAGNVLFVNNRYQLAAYDLSAGQLKWTQTLGGEQGEAHRWPLVAMRPVVAGDRVFSRRLTKHGPQLGAFEAATGKVLWNTRPEEQVASNPLLVQDELFAFTITAAQDGVLQLELTSFNPQTGDVVSRRPIIRLRDAWDRQLACSAVAVGGKLIATAGGTVLCCDLGGQPLWVRRQTWIPVSQESTTLEQQPTAPIVGDGRLFIFQRGVMGLECLDLEGGRRIWQQPLPDARRILGLAAQRLFVETSTGVVALAAETGRTLWKRTIDQQLDASLCADSGDILVAQREPLPGDVWQPALLWLDPATGRDTGAWPLDKLADKVPMLGPLVSHGDRFWTFFGRGIKDATRDLIELVPAAAAPYPGHQIETAIDDWARLDTNPRLRSAASIVLPGWSCLGGGADTKVGLSPEFQGQHEVCVTSAPRDRPAVFVRQLSFPAGSHPKLSVQVGHEPAEKWKLDVRVSGRSVQSHLLEPQTTVNGWKQFQVDLSAYAGQTVWIVVEQQPEGNTALGYWKRLDVLF